MGIIYDSVHPFHDRRNFRCQINDSINQFIPADVICIFVTYAVDLHSFYYIINDNKIIYSRLFYY